MNDVFSLKKERFGTSIGLIRQGPEFSAERCEYGTESHMLLNMETEAVSETFEFCLQLTVHSKC